MAPTPSKPSPTWGTSTKRTVTAILVLLVLLLIYWVRGLLVYILVSVVLAYLIYPLITFITRRTPLPRLAAIAVVYLAIAGILISIPLTTIPQLISQGTALFNNMPRYVEEVAVILNQPIVIGEYRYVLSDQPPVEAILTYINEDAMGFAQTVGSSSFGIFGSVASVTLSTVAWILVVLFLSFYMVKDHNLLFNAVLRIVPEEYQEDFTILGREINATWNAFLRGQLILFAIMFVTIFALATVVGLPNGLLLAFISGLAEFVPQIGATLAMIPALLVAFFQSDASWLGRIMGPFWFTMLVMGVYILLQQIENYWLVPRVIGRQLNLHPLVVFVAALAGARAAGIIGILVAAPLLATGRLVFWYIYCKLRDLPPFPELNSAVGDRESEGTSTSAIPAGEPGD